MTPSRSKRILIALSLITCLCIAPTLLMLEFSSGSENLVIATALETRRESHWLMPTLDGGLRVAKPPLATWIAAAAIPDSIVRGLSSTNPAQRDHARFWLRWYGRWPALLSACVLLIACGLLARDLGGDQIGWLTLIICASSIMFLKSARSSTTDIQLALWVTVTNLLLIRAMVTNRLTAWVGAGAALGLALMSKGPVALLQSVLPIAIFGVWRGWGGMGAGLDDESSATGRTDGKNWVTEGDPAGGEFVNRAMRRGGGMLLGAGVMLLIAIPWYLAILLQNPNVRKTWWVELTREGATGVAAGEWFSYVVLIPLMVPWAVFFVIGVGRVIADLRGATKTPATEDPNAIAAASLSKRRLAEGMILALLLVIVPVLVMSFFRDRKERYLLPMVAPAAMLCAYGLKAFGQNALRKSRLDEALGLLHWAGLLLTCLAISILGATVLKTVDGSAWFSIPEAVLLGAPMVAIAGIGLMRWRRDIGSIAMGTFAIMMLLQGATIWGYRNSREGRSEMRPLADLIFQSHPDAAVYAGNPRRKKLAPPDLSIYLNRAVPWVTGQEVIPPASTARVLVMRQDEDETEPPPTPAGASVLASVARDKSFWFAFLLDSANKQSGDQDSNAIHYRPRNDSTTLPSSTAPASAR